MSDDLVAFVAARLAEREALAAKIQQALDSGWNYWDEMGGLIGEIADPAAMLREVAAKRAILKRCAARMNEPDQYPNGLVSPRALMARQTLMDLATADSDHPDYRTEWAPTP